MNRRAWLMAATLYVSLIAFSTDARAVDTDGDGADDATDNCPITLNPTQEDRGGIASAAPDGAGDACQSGDWNQDGRVDVLDTTLIRRALAGQPPPLDPHQPPIPPVCPLGFCDSDGVPANGCEDPLDDNPVCLAPGPLGSVNGDSSSSFSISGRGELFGTALVLESAASSNEDLVARVTLQPPIGANYDLVVMCTSCAGAPSSSGNPGSTPEVIEVRRADLAGNQSFSIVIEVRWVGGVGCGSWVLDVVGDVGAGSSITCE